MTMAFRSNGHSESNIRTVFQTVAILAATFVLIIVTLEVNICKK